MLAEALGASAAALGLPVKPCEVAAEAEALLEGPLNLFESHNHWPSAASPSGIPFEFSVVVGTPNEVALRYAIDFTDHSRGLDENLKRYLQASEQVTGAPMELLKSLIATRTEGIGPYFRTRMMHGVGYGRSGRRSTLYFRAAWLNEAELRRRFPEEMQIAGRSLQPFDLQIDELEAVSHDFRDCSIARTKMYVPIGLKLFERGLHRHPDLKLAVQIHATQEMNAPAGDDPFLLQLSPSAEGCAAKMLFMASAWGWDEPERLARLLDRLGNEFGLPVEQLGGVLEAFAERGIRLQPTVLGLGGGASASFYFCPVPQVPSQTGRNPESVDSVLERMIARADDFLSRNARAESFTDSLTASGSMEPEEFVEAMAAAQLGDGGWSDFEDDADLTCTARAVAALKKVRDSSATASATAAKARASIDAAHRLVFATALTRDPMAMGSWMTLWVDTGGDPHRSSLVRLIESLRRLQRPDGCWLPSSGACSHSDEQCLTVTANVLTGLKNLRQARGRQ